MEKHQKFQWLKREKRCKKSKTATDSVWCLAVGGARYAEISHYLCICSCPCGGCGPKEEIVLKIPGTTAQINMRLIPAGNFVMGSPLQEQDRYTGEGPQHLVTITEPFYMAVYEVTQEQWLAVMETLPSEFGYTPGNPVEKVNWNDCQEFISELNTKGIGTFRLPTEAEWEYACRAGSTTRYSFGDDLSYSKVGDYAWYSDNSSGTTHIVGEKEANTWGLYDMHGNVLEWCSDWYGAYSAGAQTDPGEPSSGSFRVLRGGGWNDYPPGCRSAYRSYGTPTVTGNYLGFRLVRTSQ